MKMIKVVALIITVIVGVLAVGVASQASTIADYSGASLFTNQPLIENATEGENPDVLYVLIMADEPLRSLLQERISKLARSYSLEPVYVQMPSEEDLKKLQFKGRFLAVCVERLEKRRGILSMKYSADAVIYYSSAGDVENFVETYENRSADVEELAMTLKQRGAEEILVRGNIGVAYWKNLKVYVGYLSRKPNDYPWRAMAEELMKEIESFLKNSSD